MSYLSVLFIKNKARFGNHITETKDSFFYKDLHLDQIINSIISGKEEYNIKPFFYTPLSDIDDITYRQEIMRDIVDKNIFNQLQEFSANMRTLRTNLNQIEKFYYKYHKEWFFLDAVQLYCETVKTLEHYLSHADIKSAGLLAFRKFLTTYIQSASFIKLCSETKTITKELSSITYCVFIQGLRVQVHEYISEPDYSAEVEKAFAKFKQGPVKNYKAGFSHPKDMNHVEAKILDGVAQLYPDIFSHLDTLYAENQNFLDTTITVFEREIQFYIAYLEYISVLKRNGLKFCYPVVSNTSKEIFSYEGFDLALAFSKKDEKETVVTNDFYLNNDERVFIVTGPNQCGKTTFARAFGQIHYLASIGCPVPGREAKLFLPDKIFTHFEKEETIHNLRSKLEDDLIRLNDILRQASSNSIIIMNEILTSTTIQDGTFLSKKIMEKIQQLDAICLWVTFIDELASYNQKTVSMAGSVVRENPDMRTYRFERKPANGLAYALSIVEKYKLSYNDLKKRLKP